MLSEEMWMATGRAWYLTFSKGLLTWHSRKSTGVTKIVPVGEPAFRTLSKQLNGIQLPLVWSSVPVPSLPRPVKIKREFFLLDCYVNWRSLKTTDLHDNFYGKGVCLHWTVPLTSAYRSLLQLILRPLLFPFTLIRMVFHPTLSGQLETKLAFSLLTWWGMEQLKGQILFSRVGGDLNQGLKNVNVCKKTLFADRFCIFCRLFQQQMLYHWICKYCFLGSVNDQRICS